MDFRRRFPDFACTLVSAKALRERDRARKRKRVINSRKIVKQALSFERPDRLPIFDASIWDEFSTAWFEQKGISPGSEISEYFPNDLHTVRPNEVFFPTNMGVIRREDQYEVSRDGWGRTVKTRKDAKFSQVVKRVFDSPSDLDKIEFESPALETRFSRFKKAVEERRSEGRAVFANTGGPFIRSSFFRGETEYLIDMAGDESLAKEIANRVGEHLMNVGLEAMRIGNTYDFGIWIYDDMCNVNSPMFSPNAFERILMPVYEKMVATYKAAGARWVILHCDGNLLPLLDMLLDVGIDGINPVEYAAGMDVTRLLPEYYGKLRFVGGVCNTHILPTNDPALIEPHVREIAMAGRDGGLVIGTHSVGPDVAPGSYELYRETIQKVWSELP